MKIVSDLSVTSARYHPVGASQPWGAPWAAPISGTLPGLVLDFAAGAYGSDGMPSSLGAQVSMSRASDATSINASGLIATVASDVPRLVHDPISFAQLGLLLESNGQNLLLNSDLPADQIVSVAANPHTLTFYGTGSITLSGAHAEIVTGIGAYPARQSVTFTPVAGDLTLTVTGDVSAAQLETGSDITSYIRSLGTQAIRADEIASVALGSWFNSTSGTIVYSGHLDSAAANDRIIEIDAGATSTRLSLLWNTVLGKPQMQVWDQGALQSAIAPPGGPITLGSPFRVAMAFEQDSFAVSLNGGGVATDGAGSVPGGLTTLRLGRSVWGAQGAMIAESLTYYPTRLSNTELQSLSA